MKEQFFAFDGSDFMMAESELKAPKGYEIPKNKETNECLPNCCETHRFIFDELLEWAHIFPNCCEEHKKMAQKWTVNIPNIRARPQKLIKLISYTEYIIETNIDKPDWFDAIVDFLEAVRWCLGHPSIGYDRYLHYIEVIVDQIEFITDNEKRKKLKDYIERQNLTANHNSNADSTDINVLIATYHKWLKIFPFEVKSYFGELKEVYEKTLPLTTGEIAVNRYTGVAKAQLHTKQSLINSLINLTNELITRYNALTLFESKKLSDAEQTHFELLISERQMKLKEGYIVKAEDESKKYRKILKQWYADELLFLRQIIPYLNPVTKETQKSNSDVLLKKIIEHGFDDLPMVKELTTIQRQNLYSHISKKPMPYVIAFFNYLGFIDYLQTSFFKTKDKLFIGMAKWFGSDKDGRLIKGNINVLNPKSKEDRQRYTSHLHKEEVKNFYEKLK